MRVSVRLRGQSEALSRQGLAAARAARVPQVRRRRVAARHLRRAPTPTGAPPRGAAPVCCRGRAPKPQQPPWGGQPRVSQKASHNAAPQRAGAHHRTLRAGISSARPQRGAHAARPAAGGATARGRRAPLPARHAFKQRRGRLPSLAHASHPATHTPRTASEWCHHAVIARASDRAKRSGTGPAPRSVLHSALSGTSRGAPLAAAATPPTPRASRTPRRRAPHTATACGDAPSLPVRGCFASAL